MITDKNSLLSKLGAIDINKLETIDPIAVLGDLGYNAKDANSIMSGDYGSIVAKNKRNMVLDLLTVHKNYLQMINIDILKWFFYKAKNKEEFTEDEVQTHQENYSALFRAVFVTARSGNLLYSFDDIEEKNENLIIKVNESYFQMTHIRGSDLILYLPDYMP